MTIQVAALFAALDDYRRRCEARPAFGRALDAQMQPFRKNAPCEAGRWKD